ncbi:exodeoxyribonuclease VII large subunit [Acidaminococcus fermentans]|uniref:exodeoxyribonuclease VII large subunit n=1 Tax=Acidaminococcus fermentans TaxID=905 RepID=UPI003D092628
MIAGKIYTVSEVTRIVKGLFRKEPEFANLQIQGEVSNFRQYPSGHCYFNLKDGKTLLKAVMFVGAARRLKQLPKNGDQVLGVGRIDLYERDGVYQFYVDMMMPLGAGNLMIAYEQLKEKLTAEGLFDPGRKRPLPAYPKVVGIVTSPAGAAVRDIINVAGRRDPSVKLRLYPVKVQGTEAPPEIIRGIRFMNRHKLADVLIVGRGGGSMEDLWAFNDEGVVRAIAASEIPVISAVGHEIDFTLSDFAADLRAPTPSAAAELAVPERSGDREILAKLVRRLERTMELRLQDSSRALEKLQEEWVFTHPERLWENAGQTLDTLCRNLEQAGTRRLEERQQKLDLLAAKLGALDPYGVLRRGYTITENAQGRAVRQPSDLHPGDTLVTRFAQGAVVSQVETVKEGTE